MTKMWVISGYDGLEATFEDSLPAWMLSEPEVAVLLQRLASRHLTPSEILNSCLRKNAKSRASHLDIQKQADGTIYALSTLGNPHYSARVVDV